MGSFGFGTRKASNRKSPAPSDKGTFSIMSDSINASIISSMVLFQCRGVLRQPLARLDGLAPLIRGRVAGSKCVLFSAVSDFLNTDAYLVSNTTGKPTFLEARDESDVCVGIEDRVRDGHPRVEQVHGLHFGMVLKDLPGIAPETEC